MEDLDFCDASWTMVSTDTLKNRMYEDLTAHIALRLTRKTTHSTYVDHPSSFLPHVNPQLHERNVSQHISSRSRVHSQTAAAERTVRRFQPCIECGEDPESTVEYRRVLSAGSKRASSAASARSPTMRLPC